jgi:O-antigen/teichoic acid export membrane protein
LGIKVTMTSSLPESSGTSTDRAPSADVSTALKNTLKLGMSLVITWSLALIVRLQLPRHLGPLRFGNYNFCDAYSAAFFAFIGFGIDTYIQKEIPVRPKHLNDFFGGVVLTRAFLSAALIVAMIVTLVLTHRPSGFYVLVIVFGLTQFVITLNGTMSAALQAATKVDALASANVASKLVWAMGLMLAMWFDMPLFVFAIASLASELLRTVALWRAARKYACLTWAVRISETKKVFVASLPFYANVVAITLTGRLDVSMLEFQAPAIEVGWYSAAANLSSLGMLLSPLLGWILMPLLSRARHRSEEEFDRILCRALEGLLVVSIPITLAISLGAEFWIRLAFGKSFLPAAHSLRILAPVFIVTYVAIMLAIAHIMLDRAWRLTMISVIGVCCQPLLSIVFVPRMSRLGVGYAGCGAALGIIGEELVVSTLLFLGVGRRAVDRRCVVAVVKSLLIALSVIVLDRLLVPLGTVRIVVDGVAYLVAAVATRTVRVSDVRVVMNLARKKDTSPANMTPDI